MLDSPDSDQETLQPDAPRDHLGRDPVRLIEELRRKERARDPRGRVRREVDANRYAVATGYAAGLSWASIGELLARCAGVRDDQGRTLNGGRLRRLAVRSRIVTDQPDPAAPAGERVTNGWCPVAPAKLGTGKRPANR